MHCVQRNVNAAGATINRQEDKEEEEAAPDPATLTKIEDTRETLEDLDNALLDRRGAHGVPLLACIVRKDVYLPEATEGQADPRWGNPSLKEESIRKTRYEGPCYQQDNGAAWAIIGAVTHGGPGWSWVLSHGRHQNGREACFAIKKHYLGDFFQARTKANADKALDAAFYDGKARNFTFEKHCEKLTTAFNDLAEGEEPFPTSRKVGILLNGIRDPALEHAKSQVLTTPDLKSGFEAAMNFIAEFADARESMHARTRNVSFAGRGSGRGSGRGRGGRSGGRGCGPGRGWGGHSNPGRGGRGGRGRSAFNSQDPGQCYTPEKWSTLTCEQHNQARAATDNDATNRRRSVAAIEQEDTAEDRRVRIRTKRKF